MENKNIILFFLLVLNMILCGLYIDISFRNKNSVKVNNELFLESSSYYESRDNILLSLSRNNIEKMIQLAPLDSLNNDSNGYKLYVVVSPFPCNTCLSDELNLMKSKLSTLDAIDKIIFIIPETRYRDIRSFFGDNDKIVISSYKDDQFIDIQFDSVLFILRQSVYNHQIFLANKKNHSLSENFYNILIN
ncbi:hypothetical protein SDC9_86905 [bioreactor metagenome]|uniref:Uncharacterized protein n=1 Tax=bioreactor metagenome TaxID=1076179 RepID=A0A644ZH93_9ZZZZ|nr:hypothetical protein [Rikenellaceae bacterium]